MQFIGISNAARMPTVTVDHVEAPLVVGKVEDLAELSPEIGALTFYANPEPPSYASKDDLADIWREFSHFTGDVRDDRLLNANHFRDLDRRTDDLVSALGQERNNWLDHAASLGATAIQNHSAFLIAQEDIRSELASIRRGQAGFMRMMMADVPSKVSVYGPMCLLSILNLVALLKVFGLI